MYSSVHSGTVAGVDGIMIGVEADIHDGLPMFSMVGYLSSSVKEAAERVRTALKNSDICLPAKRITINLFPADIKKDGSGFDLPIAVAVLLCMGIVPEIDISKTMIIGELGLNGRVNGIFGVLPMVFTGKENGMTHFIVPKDNEKEAALVDGITVIGVESLSETIEYIQGLREIPCCIYQENTINTEYKVDFADIKGQDSMKRGIEIAAAGFHNVLMNGAAGAGKSMLAKRLPTIMPELSFEESIEITKIYSVMGLLISGGLIKKRPFRSPHHTISAKALVGGGINPKPGEVSLAHTGVLFLDEFPEFAKNTLEVLRQPMEDKKVTISRLNAIYTFPADCMVVAAMNSCPCGHYPNLKKCICTPNQILQYNNKISGPILDRIDINLEVKPIKYEEMFGDKYSESSDKIRERVCAARNIQRKRYMDEGIYFNSQLEGNLISKYIKLSDECLKIIKDYFTRSELSARGTNRIIKLARTIADLDCSDEIKPKHIIEAIFYRNRESIKDIRG